MSDRATVLYDAPGPKGRRRTLIISVLAGILILLAGYRFVYLPLEARGQFSYEKWGSLVDPENTNFPLVWDRIFTGLQATLTAAGWAVLCSLVFGTVLAIVRLQLMALSARRYRGLPAAVAAGLRLLTAGLNVLTRVFIEVARGLPVVVTLFFCWKLLTGFETSLWPLVIGLTIYNGVVIAEVIRSGMQGLPKGQREAADSLGLSPLQSIWLIQLPQAVRIMLPALISQMVVIVKDTSLGGVIIGYEELLAVSRQIIQVLNNPLQMWTVTALIFILINYSLSRLATVLERRLGRRTGRARTVTPPAGTGVLPGAGALSGAATGGAGATT
jgi:glutamate transport system permease protein